MTNAIKEIPLNLQTHQITQNSLRFQINKNTQNKPYHHLTISKTPTQELLPFHHQTGKTKGAQGGAPRWGAPVPRWGGWSCRTTLDPRRKTSRLTRDRWMKRCGRTRWNEKKGGEGWVEVWFSLFLIILVSFCKTFWMLCIGQANYRLEEDICIKQSVSWFQNKWVPKPFRNLHVLTQDAAPAWLPGQHQDPVVCHRSMLCEKPAILWAGVPSPKQPSRDRMDVNHSKNWKPTKVFLISRTYLLVRGIWLACLQFIWSWPSNDCAALLSNQRWSPPRALRLKSHVLCWALH